MRRIIRLDAKKVLSVVCAVMLFEGSAWGKTQESNTTCTGPTSDVLVVDVQDPTDINTHLLVVKNRLKKSIISLSIGNGIKPELHIADFAIPIKISGPYGWNAQYSFHEESHYMHWVWTVSNRDTKILPNEFVSNFKIELPDFPSFKVDLVYPDGVKVRPLIFHKLPFRAILEGGECVWGNIQSLSQPGKESE